MIFIYSKEDNPRIQYVVDFIFKEVLKVDFKLTSDFSSFNSHKGIKVLYTHNSNETKEVISIPKYSQNFSEDYILSKPPILGNGFGAKLFPVHKEGFTLDFDLFASIFYLLSRQEEYLDTTRDEHQRYRSQDSIAYQHKFHRIPLIDFWIDELRKIINQTYKTEIKPPFFTFQATYDIDMAWAYSNKGILRSIVSIISLTLNRDWKTLKDLPLYWKKQLKDPFFTFDQLERLNSSNTRQKDMYFFLCGQWSKYDKNSSLNSPDFKELISSIAKVYPIGIHPSYKSFGDFSKLQKEKSYLEKTSYQKVIRSRQHFLRLKLPDTYQSLIKTGIKEDYSMGFADEIGFRASTAHSFFWYDMSKDSVSSLKIYPFQVMDVSLFKYLNYSIEEAQIEVSQILKWIQSFGGTFSTLWHNSS